MQDFTQDFKQKRIIFMGTSDFASCILDYLIKDGYNIVAVYTQAPKAKNRGYNVTRSFVHELALYNNLKVFTPNNFKNQEDVANFKDHNADLAIVLAYGILLPKTILNTPKLGCINLHASILPLLRGAAPIQRAIEYGFKYTGMTIMQMDEGMDTGDIICSQTTELSDFDDFFSLAERLNLISIELLQNNLQNILNSKITKTKQDNKIATYANKLNKQESNINNEINAKDALLKINAFKNWPYTYLTFNNMEVKIVDAILIELNLDIDNFIGFFKHNNKLCYKFQNGFLQILRLQVPNKKITDYKSFLNGYKVQSFD